jgi:hypothetical protein
MNEEKALELYNFFVKENYDLGDFENFKLVLLNKDRGVELHSFFENEGYDVGSVNDFVLINNDPLKKKEESILPSQESNVELASGLEENTTGSSDTSPTSIADIPAYQPDIQQPIASDTTAMFNTDNNQPEVDSNKEDSYTGALDDNGNPLDPQDYNLFTEKADTFEETVDKSVTPEMISSVEEVVVPEMNYKFNRYGFEFTQEDITGDEMLVKSANGKELKVELDALFFAGDYSEELKSFLRDNKEESERLHKILNKDIKDENVFQNKKQIDNTLKIFNYETENFEKEVTDYQNVQKKLDITYKENFKGLSSEELNSPELKEKLEKYNLLINKQSEIQKGLVEKNKEFTAKGKRIDRLAGEYFEMQSEQGSLLSGMFNSALDGVSSRAAGFLDTFTDVTTLGTFPKEDIIKEARAQGIVPEEFQGDGVLENLSQEELEKALGGSTFNWFTEGAHRLFGKDEAEGYRFIDSETGKEFTNVKKEVKEETAYDKAASSVRDRYRKDVKFGEDKYRNIYSQEAFDFDNELGTVDATRKGTRAVLGIESTTEAWTESTKEGFWGGAILGLSESLPAMIGGKGPIGWATRTAQMYSQVSDGVSKEMGNNAFFDDITETEKAMVKMPIGIAVGVLESIGFSNIMKQTGLVNSLVGRALSKVVSKDMSKRFASKNFAEFIRQDVENMIAKGLLTISASGLAEFETGALQEIAEVKIKDIYNAAKDSKIFDTPDTWNQWVGQVLKAGAQEAVGGFVMGSPGAVSTSMSGLSAQKLDNSVFEMFEKVSGDPTYFNMYVSKLKQRILNPESDTDLASAKKELDDVNQLRGLLPKIPVHYTTDQKKVALQLLMQKHSLENEIGVEDKTLSKAKQELLDKVNDKLASIEKDVVNENNKNNVDATLIQDFNEGDVEVESKEERSNNVTPEEAADIETFFEGDVSEANESGNEVSNPNLTINRSESSNLNGRQKAAQNTIIKIANFGAKSISKILPNVRIVLHENNDDFLKFSKNGEGRAEYNPSNNVIHINLSSATKTTVPHEIFHAIIIDKIKSDPAIQKATEKMMVSVRKTLSKDSDLAIAIDKFAESYSDGIQNEERLAELIGILSSSAGRELSKPTKNAIVRWVTEIAKKFGINLGTNFGKNDSDVIDLLNTIARKTRKGEVIEESDVKSLKPEKKIEESAPIEEEIISEKPKTDEETKKPSSRQQMSLETISRYYNLNVGGFFPDRADIPKIRKAVESLGYGLKKSKTDEHGRGGNYFIVNSKGAKVNPLKSKVRQQKAITDIVNEARDNNFKDPQIRDFLVRVKKFSSKEVDRIMKVNIDLLQLMPKSFGNIEGGAEAGVKLFKKINDFRTKLTRKNNELKEDDRISEQEIIDKSIEFLEKQPEYINESDTYTQGSKSKGTKVTKNNKQISSQQASMVIDLQSSIGIRPTQQMAARLREARIILAQRTKGGRDLSKIKTEVRNFIRKSLPKSIYIKSEVLELIKLVDSATKDNIDNILNEVAQFVIEKNIKNLETKLEKILSGKLQANQSGRKKGNRVDNATRKRIEKIKDEIDKYKKIKEKSDTYADDILAINEKLNLEFNELQKNAIQTEETLNRMVDIQLIMEYNNSLLMDNNDSNKVTELDSIVSTLQEIIDYGRSALKEEMKEAHSEYLRQFALGYYTITGNKIDTSNRGEMEKALANEKYDRDNDAQRKKLKGKIVSFASKVYTNTLDGVFGTAEALDGLMSKIDMLPGEMFGGNLQEMFTERIDESTRVFKGRKMLVEGSIQNKLIELYGKRWAKRSRENRVVKPTGIYKNDKAKTDGRDLILSQNQMAYLYNQYKDPANEKSFEMKFRLEVIDKNDTTLEKKRKELINKANAKRVMSEIEAALDPNVKELADWQVNEFYPSLYSHYNEAYKKIYRTDMPWNQFYAGMIYREGIEKEPINMLANESIQNTSVGASSTKFRVNNNLEISDKDMVDVMASYVNEMEYFAAYSESVRDMNKLFTNKYIASAITNIHGKITYNLIQDMIQKIAAKGTPNSLGDNIVNKMNNVFIISRLALSPVVMIKQLTSFITYANDIGFGNYIKYAAKNKAQQVKIWKEVRDNSVYLQDRGNDSILRTIETYSEETMKEFIPEPAKDFVVNFMMWTTKFGDKTAIMVGGLPNYSFYKAKAIKNGATEQEAIQIAIRKFERDTKRTQQSSDLQDKDRSQNKNAVYRALNMFMTTPKQYLRKEVQSVRNISRKLRGKGGKGTYLENIRTLVMYHVVMPVFFQYVSLGLPGLLRDFRDDDDDDLLRAAIIGNLNALFILGEVVATIGDYMTDKPWAGSSVKAVGMIQIVNSIVLKANKARNVKDPEKKAKYMKDVYLDLVTGLGIPAPTINKFIENYGAIGSDGDIGKDILRILNYSKYQQEGSGKSKKKKKTKTISEINNEYRKEEAKNNKAKSKIINGSFSSDKGFGNEGYSGGGF